MAHMTAVADTHRKHKAIAAANSTSLAKEGTLDLLYSGRVYGPESVLAGWLNLSFFSITTALLFYHMTRVKSLEMDGRVAGIFAMILMAVSISYTVFAIGPYSERIKFIVDQCIAEEKCSNAKAANLRNIYYQYIALGVITSVIEVCISYVVGRKTWTLIFG